MDSATMSSPLRIAVVGAGCIGEEHVRNLALLTETIKLVAVVDTEDHRRRAAKELLAELRLTAVDVVDDAAKLLQRTDVDAVVICTPNDTHHSLIAPFVRANKHMLVEKPLCTTVAHCVDAEIAAAEVAAAASDVRAPPLLWCGMEYRYIPAVARLIREADAGAIGELKMLTIREHRFPFLRKEGNWNRWSARTGGTLVEKCVHFFDLIRRIMRAEPTRIFASGGQSINHLSERGADGRVPDILDNAYVMVDLDSGARAMLELCMFAEASKHQEEISLVGTHGKLEAFAPSHGTKTDDESLVNFRRGIRNPAFADGFDRADPPPPDECGALEEAHEGVDAALLAAGNHGGATYHELRRFAAAALEGAPPEVSLRDGSLAVMMGVAAHRSIELGAPVAWADMVREYMSHDVNGVLQAMAIP